LNKQDADYWIICRRV